MQLIKLKRVTIISERILKDEIIELIKQKGAKGFTITDVEGEGSRGIRATEWEGKNVKVETIVSDGTADEITKAVSDDYFENYAVIVYVSGVHVVRGDKYI